MALGEVYMDHHKSQIMHPGENNTRHPPIPLKRAIRYNWQIIWKT